jgi:iron complex outermembrane receptor protein
MFRNVYAILVFFVLATLSAVACGQDAQIQGQILDTTGAGIPKALVHVVNQQTSTERKVEANETGQYTVSGVAPGLYEIIVEASGFGSASSDQITLDAGQSSVFDFTLKIGTASTDIVVTAEKREERLRDVPVPVSVVAAAPLQQTGQTLLQDYFSRVPGLSVSPSYLGYQMLSIRGITTGGFTIPTVSVTLDDVPVTSALDSTVPDIDPTDLSQLEVLRGPQGTLYGANSMGGLIKYITKEPSTASNSIELDAGANGVSHGNQPGYSVSGAGNFVLNKNAAIRLSAYDRREAGYIDNPVAHLQDVNPVDAYGARADGLLHFGADTSLRLTALYQDRDAHGSSEVDHLPGLGDLQQDRVPNSGGSDRTTQSYSVTPKTLINGVRLTSITSYGKVVQDGNFDWSSAFGAVVEPIFGVSGALFHYRNDTGKITEEARGEHSFSEKVDLLVGAYYTREDTDFFRTLPAVNPQTGAAVGEYWVSDSPHTYDEYAVFGTTDIHFTDRFDVQGGLRFNEIESHYATSTQSRPLTGPDTGAIISAPSSYSGNAVNYLFTPRLRLTSDAMAYVRFASGFRPGGPNQPTSVSAGAPKEFAADTTQNYEVGLKGDFADHRLSVDASIYRINWNNIQIQERLPNLFTFTTNGPQAKSEGVELALELRPVPGLTLNGSMAYDNPVLTAPLPAGSLAVGAKGDLLPDSPRNSASATVHQSWSFSRGFSGFIEGTASYVGDRLSIFTATPTRQDLPAYTKLDLTVGMDREHWALIGYVNNLTDERGLLDGGTGYILPFAYLYITPRVYGAHLTYKF